jgi:diguanylate cyclase (GGDEF)-like protein
MSIHAEAAREHTSAAQLHSASVFEPGLRSNPKLPDTAVLRIANALQASLNVRDVIHAFTLEARRIVRGISLRYRYEADNISLLEGRAQLHRCAYELNLLGKPLGELVFMRARPMSDDEQSLIEVMLCTLVYPLRNALMYEKALKTALIDPLTGVHNRCSMEQHLEHQVLVSRRHHTALSMLMIDIDFFKNINDTFGHVVGDAVLTTVAKLIISCTRNCDVVFRYGGEEFVVLMGNTKIEGARLLGQRVCSAISAQALVIGEHRIPVSVSVGVAELGEGEGAIDLLHRADKQLYRAKIRGRNQVVMAEG